MNVDLVCEHAARNRRWKKWLSKKERNYSNGTQKGLLYINIYINMHTHASVNIYVYEDPVFTFAYIYM